MDEKLKESFLNWGAESGRYCIAIIGDDNLENNIATVIMGNKEDIISSFAAVIDNNEVFSSLMNEALKLVIFSKLKKKFGDSDEDVDNIVDDFLSKNGFKKE